MIQIVFYDIRNLKSKNFFKKFYLFKILFISFIYNFYIKN